MMQLAPVITTRTVNNRPHAGGIDHFRILRGHRSVPQRKLPAQHIKRDVEGQLGETLKVS